MTDAVRPQEGGPHPAPPPRVTVVMPAYNAEQTLERTVREIPGGIVHDVIVVDDASHDRTVEVARRLGLTCFVHPRNRGYGGNQKTCYSQSLARGTDIIVMLHPDYQYDPKRIPALIAPILEGRADAVLGSRLADGGALKGGMPFYKFLGNRFLTIVENFILGTRLTELHTGFRAYSARALEAVPFHGNGEGFVFDTQILVQFVHRGYRIAEIPVPTRYAPECSSVNFWTSCAYGFGTLWTLARFVADRCGLVRSRLFRAAETGERFSQPVGAGASPGDPS